MKYIIDMIEDIRNHIQNSQDYKLLAILLKENEQKELQNVGEKPITSFYVDDDAKQLRLGFSDDNTTTKELLECLNSFDVNSMMYEVVLQISDKHPIMNVIGFGENHEQKEYVFFVTA